MSSDDLVARVRQQAQREHDMEVIQTLTQFKAWLEEAYGLLAEIRRHLSVFVASSEQLLEPLSIKRFREVGKGRKSTTVVETELTAGWELARWDIRIKDNNIYGRYYLLHDGRLLTAEKEELGPQPPQPGDLIGDRKFLAILAELSNLHGYQRAPDKITILFENAKLTPPQLPSIPTYYNQKFKHLQKHEWDELHRQYIE